MINPNIYFVLRCFACGTDVQQLVVPSGICTEGNKGVGKLIFVIAKLHLTTRQLIYTIGPRTSVG